MAVVPGELGRGSALGLNTDTPVLEQGVMGRGIRTASHIEGDLTRMENKDVNRSVQQTHVAPSTAAMSAPIRRQMEARSSRYRQHSTQQPGSEKCGGKCKQHWRWWF